jgi:hypothetical protein
MTMSRSSPPELEYDHNDMKKIMVAMMVPDDEQRQDRTSVLPEIDPRPCVIGSNTAPSKVKPCPCCNQMRSHHHRQIVGETNIRSISSSGVHYDSLISLFSDDTDDTNEDEDELDRMMPGVLAKGVAYTVKEVIAQGYVHKKGSGCDWLGSRAWKARWAVLVVSRSLWLKT